MGFLSYRFYHSQFLPIELEKELKFKWGKIVTDEKGQTSLAKVFAGGDASNWVADAVSAIADGHQAAVGIDNYLRKKMEE